MVALEGLEVALDGVEDDAVAGAPAAGHGVGRLAGEQGGGLRGGAERHQLLGGGHDHRPARQAGHHVPPGATPGAAADDQQRPVGAAPADPLEGVEQADDHAFVRRPQQLPRRGVEGQARDRPHRPGQVGGALALEERHDHHRPAVVGRRVAVEAHPPGDPVDGDAWRSGCTPAGGSSPVASAKPATTPLGSAAGSRAVVYTVPDVPRREHRLARRQPEAEGGGHVVARPGPDQGAGPHAVRGRRLGSHLPRHLRRAEHLGQQGQVEAHRRVLEHLVEVPAVGRRPPPRPGRVAPVGDAPPAQRLGQPVVGQADGGGGVGRLGRRPSGATPTWSR